MGRGFTSKASNQISADVRFVKTGAKTVKSLLIVQDKFLQEILILETEFDSRRFYLELLDLARYLAKHFSAQMANTV